MNRRQIYERYYSQWPHLSTLYNSNRELEEDGRYSEQMVGYDNVFDTSGDPSGAYKFYMAPREEFVLQSEPQVYSDSRRSSSYTKDEDTATLEYGSSSDNNSSNCPVVTFVILTFALIAVIVAAVILSVLLSQDRRYNPKTDHPEVFTSSLTMENRTFTPELNDKNSSEFKNLEAEFCASIEKIFTSDDSPLKDLFQGCEVTEFRNGSVKANYRIKLKPGAASFIRSLLAVLQAHLKQMLMRPGQWNKLMISLDSVGEFKQVEPETTTTLVTSGQGSVVSTSIQASKVESISSSFVTSGFSVTDITTNILDSEVTGSYIYSLSNTEVSGSVLKDTSILDSVQDSEHQSSAAGERSLESHRAPGSETAGSVMVTMSSSYSDVSMILPSMRETLSSRDMYEGSDSLGDSAKDSDLVSHSFSVTHREDRYASSMLTILSKSPTDSMTIGEESRELEKSTKSSFSDVQSSIFHNNTSAISSITMETPAFVYFSTQLPFSEMGSPEMSSLPGVSTSDLFSKQTTQKHTSDFTLRQEQTNTITEERTSLDLSTRIEQTGMHTSLTLTSIAFSNNTSFPSSSAQHTFKSNILSQMETTSSFEFESLTSLMTPSDHIPPSSSPYSSFPLSTSIDKQSIDASRSMETESVDLLSSTSRDTMTEQSTTQTPLLPQEGTTIGSMIDSRRDVYPSETEGLNSTTEMFIRTSPTYSVSSDLVTPASVSSGDQSLKELGTSKISGTMETVISASTPISQFISSSKPLMSSMAGHFVNFTASLSITRLLTISYDTVLETPLFSTLSILQSVDASDLSATIVSERYSDRVSKAVVEESGTLKTDDFLSNHISSQQSMKTSYYITTTLVPFSSFEESLSSSKMLRSMTESPTDFLSTEVSSSGTFPPLTVSYTDGRLSLAGSSLEVSPSVTSSEMLPSMTVESSDSLPSKSISIPDIKESLEASSFEMMSSVSVSQSQILPSMTISSSETSPSVTVSSLHERPSITGSPSESLPSLTMSSLHILPSETVSSTEMIPSVSVSSSELLPSRTVSSLLPILPSMRVSSSDMLPSESVSSSLILPSATVSSGELLPTRTVPLSTMLSSITESSSEMLPLETVSSFTILLSVTVPASDIPQLQTTSSAVELQSVTVSSSERSLSTNLFSVEDMLTTTSSYIEVRSSMTEPPTGVLESRSVFSSASLSSTATFSSDMLATSMRSSSKESVNSLDASSVQSLLSLKTSSSQELSIDLRSNSTSMSLPPSSPSLDLKTIASVESMNSTSTMDQTKKIKNVDSSMNTYLSDGSDSKAISPYTLDVSASSVYAKSNVISTSDLFSTGWKTEIISPQSSSINPSIMEIESSASQRDRQDISQLSSDVPSVFTSTSMHEDLYPSTSSIFSYQSLLPSSTSPQLNIDSLNSRHSEALALQDNFTYSLDLASGAVTASYITVLDSLPSTDTSMTQPINISSRNSVGSSHSLNVTMSVLPESVTTSEVTFSVSNLSVEDASPKVSTVQSVSIDVTSRSHSASHSILLSTSVESYETVEISRITPTVNLTSTVLDGSLETLFLSTTSGNETGVNLEATSLQSGSSTVLASEGYQLSVFNSTPSLVTQRTIVSEPILNSTSFSDKVESYSMTSVLSTSIVNNTSILNTSSISTDAFSSVRPLFIPTQTKEVLENSLGPSLFNTTVNDLFSSFNTTIHNKTMEVLDEPVIFNASVIFSNNSDANISANSIELLHSLFSNQTFSNFSIDSNESNSSSLSYLENIFYSNITNATFHNGSYTFSSLLYSSYSSGYTDTLIGTVLETVELHPTRTNSVSALSETVLSSSTYMIPFPTLN